MISSTYLVSWQTLMLATSQIFGSFSKISLYNSMCLVPNIHIVGDGFSF